MIWKFIIDFDTKNKLWPGYCWSAKSLAVWIDDDLTRTCTLNYGLIEDDNSGIEKNTWEKIEPDVSPWRDIYDSWLDDDLFSSIVSSFPWENGTEELDRPVRTWQCYSDRCRGRENDEGHVCYWCGQAEDKQWTK